MEEKCCDAWTGMEGPRLGTRTWMVATEAEVGAETRGLGRHAIGQTPGSRPRFVFTATASHRITDWMWLHQPPLSPQPRPAPGEVMPVDLS